MPATANSEKLATWLSMGLRWGLGLLMIWLAWSYDDAKVLYFVGPIVFATGFIRPRRCIDGACDINKQ